MSLKERITEDMKSAMRSKESARLSAIRLLLAAIQQREIDERVQLTDADVVSVIEKMLKQRRDSIQQFEAAGRQDLADGEKFETMLLQAYMPAAMSEAEITAAVEDAVSASGASSIQDIGKVMAVLKPKLAGKADMAKVSALVKAKLAATKR
ncbi:MAG: GatB/YqeY domain-containing protein [Burkholderiales bacterium]